MFQRRSWLLGSVALVLASGALQGQEVTGALVGTVKDGAGQPVAGAKVEINSPKMIGTRSLTTDKNGRFRAPLLPPGEYRVDVMQAGFTGQEASDVRVSVGATIRQDFVLKTMSQSASATVEVVATAPGLDKTDTKQATSLSSEELLTLPTFSNRSFIGAPDLAAGVISLAGSKATAASAVIRGGKAYDTAYTLNGASIKDDIIGNVPVDWLLDDAVEDAQVIKSPLHPRYGRGGGIINVVTKAGGNEFTGALRSYVSRDDWEANRHNDAGRRTDAYTSRRFDIFVSGPVIKDRLWFTLSTIQKPKQNIRHELLAGQSSWTPATLNGKNWWADGSYEPDPAKDKPLYYWEQGRNVLEVWDQDYVDAKFTGVITPDHTVDFSFQQNSLEIQNRNPTNTATVFATALSQGFPQREVSKGYSYGYRGIIGGTRFIDAKYSRKVTDVIFPCAPSPYEPMRLIYGNSLYGFGVFPYAFLTPSAPDERDSQSLSVNFKQFMEWHGSHELDLGMDFFESIRGTAARVGRDNRVFFVPAAVNMAGQGWSGGADPEGRLIGFQAVNWYYSNSLGAQQATGTFGQSPVLQQYLGQDGTTKNRNTAFYVNDAWTLNNHWNVMLGLRVDRFKVEDTDRTALVNETGPLSPRIQVKYDPDGSSKHLFSGSVAKYVSDYPSSFTAGFVKTAAAKYNLYGYTGVPFGPNQAQWVDYNNITNVNNYGSDAAGTAAPLSTPIYSFDSRVNLEVMPLENPYILETTLGYRRSYQDGSFFQITAVDKEWKNDFAIYTDIKTDFKQRWGNSKLLRRRYKAMELEFQHFITPTWQFGGNYTYSRLTGNHLAGDTGGPNFDRAAASEPLQMRRWLLEAGTPLSRFAPEGFLPNHRPHKARLHISTIRPLSRGRITYTAMVRYDSGGNFGARTAEKLPTTVNPIPNGAPATTYTAWFSKRGAFNFNDTYQVDFKTDWVIPIGFKTMAFMGYLQIENVFNTQVQGTYDSNFAATQGGASYGNTSLAVANPKTFGTDAGASVNWLQARTVRASLGLKF